LSHLLDLHLLDACPGQKGVACGIRVRLADIQEQAGLLPVAHQSRKLSPTPGDDRDRGTSRLSSFLPYEPKTNLAGIIASQFYSFTVVDAQWMTTSEKWRRGSARVAPGGWRPGRPPRRSCWGDNRLAGGARRHPEGYVAATGP
jgi:hypothetical protein